MAEAGVADMVSVTWSGMLLRSATPTPIVERLSKEMRALLNDPAFRKPLEAQGFEILSSTPQEFAARLRAEHAAMARSLKDGKVQID